VKSEFVDVSLEVVLKYESGKGIQLRTDATALSFEEAIIQLNADLPVGQEVESSFLSDPPLKTRAKISRYLDWKANPKTAVLEFTDPSDENKHIPQQLMSYYTRLKKAGVQLGSSVAKDGKRL